MRYSLVSRARGSILGALLGECLACGGVETLHATSLHEWKKMVIVGTESLIELGRFDVNDWIKRQQQAGIILEGGTHFSSQVILGALPIALFSHENTIKLRQSLLRMVEICQQDNPILQDWMLAIGYTIAQSLTEKLTPVTLIPQIIAFLGDTPTQVPQILLKLNNFLEKQVGLETTQAEFSREEKLSKVMAMAFYCFLGTLEDFRLSVGRATQVKSHSVLISAFTGTLSGAYNGVAGIPVSWRFLLSKTQSARWQLTNFSRMLKLADALVATWSGVYDPGLHQSEFREEEWTIALGEKPLGAIAAPRVIRLI
ncbi:ADP-ribosylglycohydrolase family protein [Fischerella sp. PCC 9605]|uniref:ADP-ribosylglycohydrolase family protein n=1 Tax=Fischerella sp. PCC 9605 TaxID=1173024 RepID=UPI00047B69D1|nr:ADP-ribosylglycohydrolase family protein [Fischerella sp. PCC 9605]